MTEPLTSYIHEQHAAAKNVCMHEAISSFHSVPGLVSHQAKARLHSCLRILQLECTQPCFSVSPLHWHEADQVSALSNHEL